MLFSEALQSVQRTYEFILGGLMAEWVFLGRLIERRLIELVDHVSFISLIN